MRFLILAALALTLVGCGGVSEAGSGGDKLTLVAYSTPREVYAQLTKDFAEDGRRQGRQLRRVVRQLR